MTAPPNSQSPSSLRQRNTRQDNDTSASTPSPPSSQDAAKKNAASLITPKKSTPKKSNKVASTLLGLLGLIVVLALAIFVAGIDVLLPQGLLVSLFGKREPPMLPQVPAPTPSPTLPPNRPYVELLDTYPHDPSAFTQGLLLVNDGTSKFLVESTGLEGKSSARKVDIATGAVLAQYDFPYEFFGEGITTGQADEFVMLTWKNRKGFVLNLDQDQWSVKREFEFTTSTGEGWGIDSDGTHLIVSDGSSKIAFWDPKTMTPVREIDVTYNGRPFEYLNELEVAHGFIYANVWYQSVIVKIDPKNGRIVTVYDCSKIIQREDARTNRHAVLNGIAYDRDEDVFYITGKLWNNMFKVRLHG